MKKYSTLILDNQEENIVLTELMLREYCKSIGDIYTATTLKQSEAICLKHAPDILFLNLNLDKGKIGFQLIKNLPATIGEVIFIASHDDCALEAIACNASSYLLKPFSASTFVKAVNKAIASTSTKREMVRLVEMQKKPEPKNNKVVAIAALDNVYLVDIDDILYCEAQGGYTRVHLKNHKEYISSRSISDYESILDKSCFFRIHHKYLVNINHIDTIDKKNGYSCILKNHQKLPVAARRQENFNRFLQLKTSQTPKLLTS